MTKTEIYNNIKYNENLVRQYQRTISSLQNKNSSLNSQINGWNNQISSSNLRRSQLQSQISELTKLKIKYKTLQDNFASRQSRRSNKLTLNFAQKANTFKFLSSYVIGMKSLLSGNEYKSAYNGLSAAMETIAKKVKTVQIEIDIITRDISTLQSRINANQNERRATQEKINQTNGDLAYRQQRIVYWKNQLSSATD